MTSAISNFVFKRVLQEHVSNNQGRDDPYFETVPTKKLVSYSGKPRMKRVKKALPPGLSTADEKTLVKVKRRAYRLDMALGTCCGIKLGWGSVIGLVPGFGDVIDTLFALMVVRTCSEAEIPSALRVRMLINVVLDFVVGLVPFVGDLADMWYKCNTRNAILLEDYLRRRGAENLRQQGVSNGPVDYSLRDVEEEPDPLISEQPRAPHPPAYIRGGEGGRSRGDYDVEAQRPASDARGSRKSKSKSKTRSTGNKIKKHHRMSGQETGTT